MHKEYENKITIKSSTWQTSQKDSILHYKKIYINPKYEGNCNVRRKAREAIQFSTFKNEQWLRVLASAGFALEI